MNGQGHQIQFDFRAFTTNKPIEELDNLKTESEIKNTTQQKIQVFPQPPKSPQTSYKNTGILQKSFDVYFKKEKTIDITLLNIFLHDKYILNKNSPETTKKKLF